MTKQGILYSITGVLAFVFGAMFFSPFFITPKSDAEVKAVSEQALYIPANYTNIGIPLSTVVLPDGNLWYVDVLNGRIVKVTPSGTVLRTVGRYGTGEGEFDGELSCITRDSDGYLYVQTFKHTYKLDANGGYIMKWGELGVGDTDYSNPLYLHYDSYSDAIFVSNSNHHEVMKFSKTGDLLQQFGTLGTGDGQFSHPTGITTNPTTGRIYVVDGDHERAEAFSPNGTFLFTFGSPGSGDGQFTGPHDVEVKPNGNVLVASQNSQKIQEFTADGTWVSSWGENGSSAWQFLAPRSISQDSSGNLYITDYYLKSIQKFTSNGTFISAIRNSGNTSGKFTTPDDVAYDSAGNLYVLDNGAYNGRVQKFTNSGTYLSTIIDLADIEIASYHIAIHNDQLYITSVDGFRKFDLSGNLLYAVSNPGNGDGQFTNARGIAIDSNGNVYVADGGNRRIEKFDSSGNYVSQWGSAGTANGQFGWPEAIKIDSNDKIYVADNQFDDVHDNTRIQVFNTSGVYQSTIGSFGDQDGQFFNIGGMAFDENGKLHVSEKYYTKIQVFNTNGTFSSKYADKLGSGVEEVFEPGGMALNPTSGNVSVADAQNHRVQIVPSGTRIYNLISSADVLSTADSASLVYRYFDPQSSGINSINSRLYFGPYVVSDFSVNLSQDRDWTNVNVLTLPDESKSLVVNLDPTNAPGISASHSLYIVKQAGQTVVHVCPNATVLADISESCSGGYDLAEGSATLSTVTIGGKTYWKVTNLTGTGIMSVSDGSVTETPTVTATPTTTVTATTTPTTLTTTTVTPTVTDTHGSNGPSTTIIAAVTLPPVSTSNHGNNGSVKGDVPVCPIFDKFTNTGLIVKQGESVTFKWATRNTELVRSAISEKDLPAVGEIVYKPVQTGDVTFTADNGYCTAKKTATIMVVESLPWTNTITVGTGLLLVEAAFAIQQPAMFGNIWLAVAGFLSKKKRQTWGIVYNSSTKKPLGRVILRLLRQDKTVADTIVSEANGTFRLTPKIGKYTITAALAGYTFPSKTITAEVDGGYGNIYRGQEINVTDTAQGILVSIPMDVAALSDEEKKRLSIKSAISEIIEIGSNVLMFAGFAYGFYVAYKYPHIYNYIILAVYALVVLAKLFLVLPKKTAGIVVFADGEPVEGVELGLFDVEFKNLLYRTFTNVNGEYSFVVPNKKYNLKIMDDRYRIVQKGELVKDIAIEQKGSDSVRVITQDLRLE